MYKQIVIVRKDLHMSPGKLAAQVSHASMAFLTAKLRSSVMRTPNGYHCEAYFDKDVFEQWIDGSFTKCVLQAKNKNKLLKAIDLANEIGLQEGEDFYLIRDNCRTELVPEEDGRTLTCIGFRPMAAEIIDAIGKKYHLYI